MALRNLKTSLKDLSFGSGASYDRPNQGHSPEPFMTSPLIKLGGESAFNAITGGFIRGGILKHAERNLTDITRIGKFLITGRGITFLAKQIGLQKSNPKVSEPGFGRSNANHRTYNFGINTLAQVLGQGTGLHVNRQGLTPFAKDGYKDEKKFLADYKKGNNTNKLLHLFDNHISTDPAGVAPPADPPTSKLGKFFAKSVDKFNESKLGKFLIGEKPSELYSYNGGPGSTYGIGKTNIYKYSNTNIKGKLRFESKTTGPFSNWSKFNIADIQSYSLLGYNHKDNDLESLNNRDNNFNLIGGPSYDDNRVLASNNVRNYHGIFEDHILNGRTRVKNYLHTLGKIPQDNYSKTRRDGKSYHREERVNLGNPGGNPLAEGNTTVDLINALDVFENDGNLNSNDVRDLIRFRFEAVDSENPTKSNVMVFRAFLDTLSDNFNASYNEFNYNGRGETFYTYNGFKRDVSLSFKIAAQSSKEMKPLYRKLNYLVSNTAPEYSKQGRMRTPFMKLTVGSYFERLPGVIKSVGITWQKDYPWEITLNGPEGGSTKSLFILPHVLDVNITYTPIHDFLPQKGIDSPFIIPHKNSPIASTPGRKSWNGDRISPNLKDAVSKIGK